jgi:UDP-N-acetylglucosamine--N-acetylmuramyl-(pentapeptide) pyrophosphoryl-undecaprenol N-acetylglucosamine transferase
LAKVYFTPYGVGLGHASRLVMLAEQLNTAEIAYKFSSSGEAAEYINSLGYECNRIPSIEFVWTSEGQFSITSSIAKIPEYFVNFSKQVNYELKNLTQFGPDIVVSDTRLSPIFASKILRIPSIVILNQVKLLLSPRLRRYKVARSFEAINGELLGLGWTLTDKILVPDLPPPYTISENSIWGTDSIKNKLKYVGFASPRTSVTESTLKKVCSDLGLRRDDPVVFIHVSGPMETRMPLVRLAMDACRSLKNNIQYIISAGYPGGDTCPKVLHNRGWLYEWCPVRDELFSLSDLVVIRGGHAVISQAIKFGKPIVAIPIENHGEQLGNSNKIVSLGLGVAVFARPLQPVDISDAINEVMSESNYHKKALELMRISENLNGIENIVNVIRTYIK